MPACDLLALHMRVLNLREDLQPYELFVSDWSWPPPAVTPEKAKPDEGPDADRQDEDGV